MSVVEQHGPDCGCHRCQGAQPGNQLARRHGAYSTFGTSKRGAQLAAEIRDVMPVYDESDEVHVRLLGTTLARCEAASVALDKLDEALAQMNGADLVKGLDSLQRLRSDLRSWIRLAARLADGLGLSPLARGRLGVSVAQIGTEQARRALLERYTGREVT
jgi:hypothetical protein